MSYSKSKLSSFYQIKLGEKVKLIMNFGTDVIFFLFRFILNQKLQVAVS